MSRSKHQSHPIARGKNARRPKPNRKRKHRPLGLHSSKYNFETFKSLGWGLDSAEKWACSDISNKSKGRQEGKKEIERQLNEEK